ncbi:MAG: lysophospholipid acyltransferase family protein [Shimia sp.]
MATPPSTPPSRARDLAFRAENAAFLALVRLLGLLPYGRRLAAWGWLARRVIGPVTGYRARALANLEQVYPGWTPARRRAVADRALEEFGRVTAENYSYDEFAARIATHEIGGAGLAPALEALAQGKPIIFSSGHWSNHEATRIKLDQLGFEVGGIYRPMKNPHFDKHYVEGLQRVSGPAFPQGREGTQAFLRFLSQGGQGFLLHDVFFARGKPLPLLGHEAMTSFAAAELALRFDALLIPYFGTRQADGVSFEIELEAPVPHGTPDAMMRDLVDRLEARIARDPGQWFWIHRRWKR